MLRIVALLALVSGCSIALQSKPSTGRVAASECSTSSAYWIADAVGVAAAVAAMTYSAATSDRGSDRANIIGGAGAVGGILYAASAGNGYRWAHECRDSQERAPVAAR